MKNDTDIIALRHPKSGIAPLRTRAALHSPGRPGVARREERRQFWELIAAGRLSESAALEVGAGEDLALAV